MKKNINNKRGTVLRITGISGSGKTTISKLIYKKFQKKYGPTIIFQGDELRKIFNFKDYSKLGRISNGLIFSDLIKGPILLKSEEEIFLAEFRPTILIIIKNK